MNHYMTKTSLNLKSVISSHTIIDCKIDKLPKLLGYCQPQAWQKLKICMAGIIIALQIFN